MAFALPTTPLGKFVGAHYSPALQAGAFRKLKAKGFAPPGTTAGGSLRQGGTARDRLLPPELIGVQGVRGAFAPGFTPRLNPNDYVVHTNDRGRTFWEPITETTGLDPTSRAALRTFDTATAGQRPVIQGAYNDLQGALNTNADQSKARLASLGSSIQASPTVAGSQQAVPDANAQLADARRAEMAGQAAVTVGLESALPQIAATEGAKTLTGWDASRAEDRTALLTGLRGEQQKQAAAALEAAQAQAQINAQLRGQDLQLLGTQTAQQGGIQRALIGAQSKEAVSQGELQTRLLIAELQGNTSEANNIRTTMARLQAAQIAADARARTGGAGTPGARAKDTAAFVKGVRGQLTGSQIRNPKFKSATLTPNEPQFIQKPGTVDEEGLISDALTQGVKIVPVLNAIRAVRGSTWARSRQDAEQLRTWLVNGGMPSLQASKIVKAFTGVSPTSASSG